jgi:alkaline phosphatase D
VGLALRVRLNAGRIECLQAAKTNGCRTVSVMTRELVAGQTAATITARTGTLAVGAGFSGFLVGAGAGLLDYRAAALVGCRQPVPGLAVHSAVRQRLN